MDLDRSRGGTVTTRTRFGLFLWLAAAGAALAQAPCPCPAPPAGPPPLWSGSAELSFLSTSGNTTTSSFGSGLEVDYKPAPWTVIFKAGYLRAATDGVTTVSVERVPGIRDPTPRVDVYAGGAYLRNRFAGINSFITAKRRLQVPHRPGAHVARRVGWPQRGPPWSGNRNYASARAGLGYVREFSKTAAL
jgi:hypothetical protein